MQLRFSVLSAIILFPLLVLCQSANYPRNYFRNPLDIPMQLAANFGEIRPNHWHMGLDIRTNHQENLPVYAAADGYIAKIRIEPAGFGRAIFINHPNGLTTVYGHLNNFSPELQQYITSQQYKLESWQVDMDMPSNLFPVRKGQLIAYSGNTGGSQGPHLHFEIRDTKTTRCLNPLLFGLPLKDDVPPAILRLGMYNRGLSVYEQSPKLFPLKKTGNNYTIPNIPVIKTGLRKISFAIQAYDRYSGSNNPNGIYGAALFLDEKPFVDFYIDSIDYIETHAINAQVDYKYQYNGGPDLQHVAQLPGDHCNIYHHISGDGVIALNDTITHTVRIEVKDAYLNVSTLIFKVQYDANAAKTVSPYIPQPQFNPNFVNTLEKEEFELYLPENILYDTVKPVYTVSEVAGRDAISALHRFCDASIPPGDYFSVRIKPNKSFPSIWGDKLLIKNEYGRRTTIKKAEWQNGWLTAKFDDFGTYQAFADTEAPAINAPGRGDTIDLSPASRIVFVPTDNFGIKSFRAELDGKWLCFTNDKGRSHIYNFDERCPYGVHSLKVTVTDLAGNITVKNWWFKKYPYTAVKKKAVKKKGTSSKKKTTAKKKKK